MNASVSLTFTFTQDRIIRYLVASSAIGVIYALATTPSSLPPPLTGVAFFAITAVAITIERSLSRAPTHPERNANNLDVFIDDFVVAHRLPEQRRGNRNNNQRNFNNNNIRQNNNNIQRNLPRRNPRRGINNINIHNPPHDPNQGPNIVD